VKVLVTDDAADFRLYLRVLLQRWGYQVVEAADGQEALACLEANDIRLVVSDWMMPGMSGPDLCRAARATDLGHYVYIILLTGRSDSADLVEGLDAGADDFVTKPFEAQVLRARLRVGERILALEQRLADQNHDLQESRNKLAHAYNQIQADLAIAARIQRQLLPTSDKVTLPCRAQWLFLPAAQVSGDSFNFFELTPGLIGFYHLDISGHGVPAALLSVSLNHSLVPGGGPGIADTDFLDPARFLVDLNRQLTNRDGEVQNYATIAYGTLEKHTGQIRLALAGHPYPILIRQGGEIEYLRQGGLPVGMFSRVDYETQELWLDPGDKLILYSDGITECSDPGGEAFGYERFRETLARASQALGGGSLAAVLEQRLREWRGPFDFEDDISMLALERPLGEPEDSATNSL
jgi:sigma-B regulation protein RsbU (phosphoserine phosphatase)